MVSQAAVLDSDPDESLLRIYDERGNSLVVEYTGGGNGALLHITAAGDSTDVGVLFWLKSDRVGLLVDVLKKI